MALPRVLDGSAACHMGLSRGCELGRGRLRFQCSRRRHALELFSPRAAVVAQAGSRWVEVVAQMTHMACEAWRWAVPCHVSSLRLPPHAPRARWWWALLEARDAQRCGVCEGPWLGPRTRPLDIKRVPRRQQWEGQMWCLIQANGRPRAQQRVRPCPTLRAVDCAGQQSQWQHGRVLPLAEASVSWESGVVLIIVSPSVPTGASSTRQP